MPINVTVYVNDRFIKQYRIGREEGGTDPDSINKYRILEFEGDDDETKLWGDGDQFTHRYGDGIDVCIQKGLVALTTPLPAPKNPFAGIKNPNTRIEENE